MEGGGGFGRVTTISYNDVICDFLSQREAGGGAKIVILRMEYFLSMALTVLHRNRMGIQYSIFSRPV